MFRFLTIPKNIKSKTKQKQQKPLYHFSFLRRIFGKAFLDLFLPWSNPAEDYIQRLLSKYLQKVQLSSEKQINWDRLVNLPESPSAALLLQCKEKAKTCSIGSLHHAMLWQANRGFRLMQVRICTGLSTFFLPSLLPLGFWSKMSSVRAVKRAGVGSIVPASFWKNHCVPFLSHSITPDT